MGVQQEILKKLGESLVLQVRKNIEPMKASGRTSNSVHAVATDNRVDVLAFESIGTAEYGRKPTGSGATRGNPTLFEQIKEWAQIRGIVNNINDRKQLGIVYAITKKIHKEGWKTKLVKPLSSVVDNLDLDALLRELFAYEAAVLESEIIKELKQLE